jgi:tetratricopeptide (TPR) repeat protein
VSSSSGLGSPRPLLHNLALAYEAQEQWLEAAEAWRAMLRTRPRKSAAKDPEKAAAGRAADAQPADLTEVQWAWVRKRVIECYKRAGAPGEAVTVFRQAIKADPDDLDLRLQLVDALLLNDQEQAAYNELQRILEIDPRHVEARLRLATLQSARREWLAAEATLRAVLAEHPEREDIRRQMAQLLLAHGLEQLQWGQLAPAARAFEEGRQFAPADHQFPLNLARVAIDQRKPERAKELIDQALELAGDQPLAYTQVVECWVVADKIDEVRAVLARAETALPATPDFYIGVGTLLLHHTNRLAFPNPFAPPPPKPKAGDNVWVQLATEVLDRAVALKPDEPRLRLQIATELMQMRPDMALRYAEEGVRMLPDEPGALMLLGLLLGVNDRKREAKETLRRGARLARQQGNAELAQEIEGLRQQIDSPFLQYGLSLGSMFDDLDDDDDEFFW